VSALAAAGLAGGPAACASLEDVLRAERSVLENGLVVITLTDPGAPVASFQVWYRGGPRLDPPDHTGLAHLFEHLLSGPAAGGGPSPSEAVAEAGGGSGAYTTWDALVFTSTVPADALELCVRLEAERMSAPPLDAKNLARERARLGAERAAQAAAQPLNPGLEALIGLVFPGHPYAWPLFGREGDLDSLTPADLADYARSRLVPDRATVVMASSLSHRDAVALVGRHFGALPRSGAALPEPPPAGEQTHARGVVAQASTGVPVLLVGYRGAPASSPDQRALEIAQHILSEGSSSRLSRRLVEKDRAALLVGGSSQERFEAGLVSLYAYARPGVPEAGIESGIFTEVAQLAGAGPSPEELVAAQEYLEAKYLYRLQTAEGRAQAVAQASVLLGDAAGAALRPAAWRAVTAADVRRVASTYFAPERRNAVWLRPTSAGGTR
jgi:predicted Zn-dependent peptidase